MKRTSITYLQDILDSADKVEEFVSGASFIKNIIIEEGL